jgi:hypothetical protein
MAATRSIELRTSLPGPRSQEILARTERAVAGPLVPTFQIVAAEARGATSTATRSSTSPAASAA